MIGRNRTLLTNPPKFRSWLDNATPFVIGHRGGSNTNAPENTYSNINLETNPEHCFEIDVSTTKEPEAYIMHDDTVNRTTNGTGTIFGLTAAYMDTLSAGAWFDSIYNNEPVPKFSDIVKIYGGKRRIFLDIRSGANMTKIVSYLTSQKIIDSFLCNCQTTAQMDTLYNLLPTATIGYYNNDVATVIDTAIAHHAKWISLNFDTTGFDSTFVTNAHNAGLKVISATIFNKYEYASEISKGVDGLICQNAAYLSGDLPTGTMTLPYTLPCNDGLLSQYWVGPEYVYTPITEHIQQGNGYIEKTALTTTTTWIIHCMNKTPSTGTQYINYTMTPLVLDADTTRYTSLVYSVNDKIQLNLLGNVYYFNLRENGTMEITKCTMPGSCSTLASQTLTGNMVVDTPIDFLVTITPTQLKFKRLDNNTEITATDSTHRGGYLGALWSKMASKYSNIIVTE